ncbi:MAG: hypothetical protein JWM95_680 [Gemmatimonadetes bacterium]|nr:hypothetical protein [Gemmatimonadota bacterium]
MVSLIIGLAVSRSALRVVALRRGHIVWTHMVARSRDASLSADIERLLAERPAMVRRRARLVAAVGAAESQLRPLAGLPSVKRTELDAMIAQNVDRFFVQGSGRQRISAPQIGDENDVWVAAVPEDVVAEIAKACHATGIVCDGVVPVAAVLHHLTSGDADADVLWEDDGIRLRVAYRAGRPKTVIRERAEGGDVNSATTSLDLRSDVDPSFAAALAATRVRRGDAFVIAVNTRDVVQRARARVRMSAWIAIAVAGLIVAAWVPGAQSEMRAARAHAGIAKLARKEHELRAAERELARATVTINAINAFEASRRSATVLLGELALALPDSTAITTLRVDSTSGALTVLTVHAPATLDAMAGIPGIAHPQLAGSITREMSAGRELERASIRFTLAPLRHAVARAPSPIRSTAQR